jgi:methionyl-tRNA formyltransferase
MPLRIVFMGTPEFAVPTLLEIVARTHEIVAVYARAAKPAGRRGLDPIPSPVEREAQRFGLPVLTPSTLRTSEAQAIARGHGADVAVVVAYGLILPDPILEAFPLGAFNLHASLLPRWRGAAPIHRAIMAGDSETGVMVMKMDEGLDTGPIAHLHHHLGERVPIEPDATAGELHDRLAHLGADLMVRALGALERGSLTLTPQPQAGVTYASKIDKGETRIVWARPWQEVHNHIRGLSPFPGAWFELEGQEKKGEPPARVKVLRSTKGEGSGVPGTVIDDDLTVACRDGAVRVLELQRAGRQVMKAGEFLRGSPLPPGARLG